MKKGKTKSMDTFVRIKKIEDEHTMEIVKMIKASSKVKIISETEDELIVCPQKAHGSLMDIAPKVHLFNVSSSRFLKSSFLSSFFVYLFSSFADKNDFAKIINISGFFIDK